MGERRAGNERSPPKGMKPSYRIHPCPAPRAPVSGWNDPCWAAASVAEILHFLPESSPHRPPTQVRVLAAATELRGIFRVEDQYVRCQRIRYFEEVWKDSCVEFFVQPQGFPGYFNFEFNCGGGWLCNYITDARRTETGFAQAERLPLELAAKISVHPSLPGRTDPEISEPLTWFLSFQIPFAVFAAFGGPVERRPGAVWRGNFFKCAEEVSHPHWAAWSPVDEFNFHLPRCFGELVF